MATTDKTVKNTILTRKRKLDESISVSRPIQPIESKRRPKYRPNRRPRSNGDHKSSEIKKSDERRSQISASAETRSGSMTKEGRFKFRKIIRDWSSKTSTIDITTVFYGSKEISIRYTTSSPSKKEKSIDKRKLKADLDQLKKLLEPCVLDEKIIFERIKEMPRYTPTTATIGVTVGELDERQSVITNKVVLGPAIQLRGETQVLITGHDRRSGENLYNQSRSIVCQVTENIRVENIAYSGYVDYATATFIQNPDPATRNPLMLENLNSPISINERQYQICTKIKEPQEKSEVLKVTERHTNGLIDIGVISHEAVDVNNRANIRHPQVNIQQTPYMYECIAIKRRQQDGRLIGEFHSEGGSGLTVGYMEESNDNHTPRVIHPVATLIGIYEEKGRPQETYSIGVPLSRTIEAVGPDACIKGELCHSCSHHQQ